MINKELGDLLCAYSTFDVIVSVRILDKVIELIVGNAKVLFTHSTLELDCARIVSCDIDSEFKWINVCVEFDYDL